MQNVTGRQEGRQEDSVGGLSLQLKWPFRTETSGSAPRIWGINFCVCGVSVPPSLPNLPHVLQLKHLAQFWVYWTPPFTAIEKLQAPFPLFTLLSIRELLLPHSLSAGDHTRAAVICLPGLQLIDWDTGLLYKWNSVPYSRVTAAKSCLEGRSSWQSQTKPYQAGRQMFLLMSRGINSV